MNSALAAANGPQVIRSRNWFSFVQTERRPISRRHTNDDNYRLRLSMPTSFFKNPHPRNITRI